MKNQYSEISNTMFLKLNKGLQADGDFYYGFISTLDWTDNFYYHIVIEKDRGKQQYFLSEEL